MATTTTIAPPPRKQDRSEGSARPLAPCGAILFASWTTAPTHPQTRLHLQEFDRARAGTRHDSARRDGDGDPRLLAAVCPAPPPPHVPPARLPPLVFLWQAIFPPSLFSEFEGGQAVCCAGE